jgi:antitoxin CptB
MTTPPEDALRRKRLCWRATHRGIREMDLILGGFVTGNIGTISAAELDQLEAIMDIPDQDLLNWATKQQAVPPELSSPLLLRILELGP